MAKTMGRPTIFVGRKAYRFQGVLTPAGAAKFEAARARLADLAGLEAAKASDGNTVEYLARGEKDTIAYLKAKKKR